MKKILSLIISFLLLNFSVNAEEIKKIPQENEIKEKTSKSYNEFIKIYDNPVYFSSRLKKYFTGHIYTITNKYKGDLKIEKIEQSNTITAIQAANTSITNSTPLSKTFTIVGGLLALPTLGISCVLIIPGIWCVTHSNQKVTNELRPFYEDFPENITIKSGSEVKVKIICEKTFSTNHSPYIKLNFLNPENGDKFKIEPASK